MLSFFMAKFRVSTASYRCISGTACHASPEQGQYLWYFRVTFASENFPFRQFSPSESQDSADPPLRFHY